MNTDIRSKPMGLKLKVFHYIKIFLDPILRIIFALYYRNKEERLPLIKDEILKLPAVEVARRIRKKVITSVEVVEACIRRIKEVNPVINGFVEDRFTLALKKAKEADELIRKGQKTEAQLAEDKPFLGVPFTTKDSVAVTGLSFTSGLKLRKGIIAEEDADVIRLLRGAGAIVLGSTNVPELCMWWESNNCLYGRSKNPYNTTRIVGGSSGGEGCIQAAAGSMFGVGTDIGGSIRMPSYFNGIFGHKPSRHIVSNGGQYPPTLENELFDALLGTGPMTRHAVDLKPLLGVMAGEKIKKLKLNEKVDIGKLKVFYQFSSNAPMVDPVEPEIIEAMKKVVAYLENKHKVQTKEVKIDRLRSSMAIWSANMKTEEKFGTLIMKSGNLFNICKELIKSFFGWSDNTMIALITALLDYRGPAVGSEKYNRYLRVRAELEKTFKDILGENGVLLYPTHPTAAPYHNETWLKFNNISYTGIINCVGLPATTIPLGLNKEGLPIGLQVIANHDNDRLCLAIAEELEKGFGGWREPQK